MFTWYVYVLMGKSLPIPEMDCLTFSTLVIVCSFSLFFASLFIGSPYVFVCFFLLKFLRSNAGLLLVLCIDKVVSTIHEPS